MTFDFEKGKPFYQTPDRSIAFFLDKRAGPCAYNILIRGQDSLYVHDRTLSDLTNPEVSTDDMMRRFEVMSGVIIDTILDRNKISPIDFHVALLQLRIKEQEEEISAAYRDRT